jgi:hypothetical protein
MLVVFRDLIGFDGGCFKITNWSVILRLKKSGD